MLIRPHNSATIVAVITIVCLAPFVNKAFHIDDPLFIWAAKHIQTNPVDFYGFYINWYGWDMSMAEVTKNPPVTCYYIALVAYLFGWSEVTMHIAFLIPAVAAALGTFYLARQFCSQPTIAALASVLTPGFLVSSTNIMCDTMMLALWVWAVFLWVRAIAADKHLGLFFAVVLVTICALTKYFGMALLPLLFAYSLMQKRKLGLWVLFLLVPVVTLAGYQWATHILYGYGLLSDAAAFATQIGWMQGTKFFSKGLAGIIFTGGCIAVALFYSPLLWSKRVIISGFVLTILFIFLLSYVKKIGIFSINEPGGARWDSLIQIGLMTVAGATIIGITGADFLESRNAESLLLLLWVFGTFIFASFINWTINARSVLPMTPAVGILLMRRIDRYNKAGQRIKTSWVAWPLVPAALIALLVCWADYTWANTARTAAAEIHKKFRNRKGAIWFQGHWGFQYYMESAGAKAIDFQYTAIEETDVIIIPSNNTFINFSEENLSLIEVLRFTPYRKLATMSQRLGAGFYSGILGPLPFAFGPVDLERYSAYRKATQNKMSF